MKFMLSISSALRGGVAWLGDQASRLVDQDQWRSASSARDRVGAVSWSRASILGLGIAAGAGALIWIVAQPQGLRAHPPRLPTEQEWRANQQAADAMKADLSPALAAANRSITSETP